MSEPARFFSRITNEDRAWPPIAFAIICGFASAVLAVSFEFLIPVDFGAFGGGFGLRETVPGRFGGLILAGIVAGFIFVLVPLFVLLGLYILSFIYQILIRLIVGRENAGYWATFKIYAYTSVVGLISWVPFIGILASLYGYYLIFIAVREAHSTTTTRAAIVAAIPLTLFLASFAFSIVMANFAGGQAA